MLGDWFAIDAVVYCVYGRKSYMLYNCFCMCPCCSLVCWALQVFSPPARRGSLDFNRGAGPSLLLLRLLAFLSASSGCCHAWTRTADRKLRWMWTVPGPDRHIASSGGCGVCLGLIAILRAQEAVTTISRAQEAVWSWTFSRHGFPYLIEKSAIDPRL